MLTIMGRYTSPINGLASRRHGGLICIWNTADPLATQQMDFCLTKKPFAWVPRPFQSKTMPSVAKCKCTSQGAAHRSKHIGQKEICLKFLVCKMSPNKILKVAKDFILQK